MVSFIDPLFKEPFKGTPILIIKAPILGVRFRVSKSRPEAIENRLRVWSSGLRV